MCNSALNAAPRGVKLHIVLCGRRNAGKSSLLNYLSNQQSAIVSETKGTTTDAVRKPFELHPVGPATLIDTAGLDDTGALGLQRIAASRRALQQADIAVYVLDEQGLDEFDRDWLLLLQSWQLPILVVANKQDLAPLPAEHQRWLKGQGIKFLCLSTQEAKHREDLVEQLVQLVPADFRCDPVLAADCYRIGEQLLLVAPIDSAAPKGRLILPQVQVLREALDNGAIASICRESELATALAAMPTPPALVVTDAQAVRQVAAQVPDSIPLTTFSTLFARAKGDLPAQLQGAEMLERLEDGDRVLIAEACSHEVQDEDIGRVKIPAAIGKLTGKQLEFSVCAGHDFPADLERYKLVVHCGACMLGRAEMQRRILECRRRGVAITNYGLVLAKASGVLERVSSPLLPVDADAN
ncbi:[FeFe] hydrogenase H-cluster maturation GTPase HydF [Shewanella algae]|uniref:tRNA modification GTPase MnmE n=1 Tax=Shewanella algae TaxID=38313 RepID=A0A380A389_9GAMM|nr:[FeFe] hydrogenase H-cluster maturation GTPase HydF [Shewanella algae]MBO2609314.1 [FeFe] hydrogenase H-cluster maturation GTPase HydF [Shewanella algae]SUI73652.1 tRNA modification GTPase MnmE [Shewanella algae]